MVGNGTKKDQSTALAALVAVLVAVLSIGVSVATISSTASDRVSPSPLSLILWSTAQWIPLSIISNPWQQQAWSRWEDVLYDKLQAEHLTGERTILEIPTVHTQQFAGQDPIAILKHLEATYGYQWRRRPVLFKGLWSSQEISAANSTRRLSRAGLLQEDLVIPYFRDARLSEAITPNDKAAIKDIVYNISHHQAPHKIGTQLLVQTYPEMIQEVAPTDIVTTLFGDRFQPHHVSSGAFGVPFLPSLTTVPVFVASIKAKKTATSNDSTIVNGGSNPQPSPQESSQDATPQAQPFTTLHCEPIGNIAVQLEGEKQWTLVSPEYSFLLQPSLSPDGRSFFVSGHKTREALSRVPRYYATTGPGDAIWVPTWTWHRVDYYSSSSSASYIDSDNLEGGSESETAPSTMAIGASLFHLRPKDLVWNNPLFAFLVVPSLIKEVLKINSQ